VKFSKRLVDQISAQGYGHKTKSIDIRQRHFCVLFHIFLVNLADCDTQFQLQPIKIDILSSVTLRFMDIFSAVVNKRKDQIIIDICVITHKFLYCIINSVTWIVLAAVFGVFVCGTPKITVSVSQILSSLYPVSSDCTEIDSE